MDEKNMHNRKTYVCNRIRMANFLKEHGFLPYKIAPDYEDPKRNVFLYDNTPELCGMIMEYLSTVPAKKPKACVIVEIRDGVLWNINAPPNVDVVVRNLDEEGNSMNEEETGISAWSRQGGLQYEQKH